MISTLKFIYNHPFNKHNKVGALIRFFKWQFNCIINPYPILFNFTEKTELIAWKGLTAATGNLYCGLMEYNDMGFLLHFLRESDLFVDIGSNIGTFTILASGEIGSKTIAIEPVPTTFNTLSKNISVNQIDKRVEAHNIALGNQEGTIEFTKNLDTVNHVATEGEQDTIKVKVLKLDTLLSEKKPSIIKIDVEGFETEVLNGASSTLKAPELKVIIIELNGSGERYGYDETLIHKKLLEYGFKPFAYKPEDRTLNQLDKFSNHNTIYIRDLDYVTERTSTSRKVKIGKSNYCI